MPSLHSILAGIFFHTKPEGKFYFTHFNVPESTFLKGVWGDYQSGAIPNQGQPLAYSPGPMVHHHRGEVVQAALRATVLRLRTRERAARTELGAVVKGIHISHLNDLQPVSEDLILLKSRLLTS